MVFKSSLCSMILALASITASADDLPFIATIPVEIAVPQVPLAKGQAQLSIGTQNVDKLQAQLGLIDGLAVLAQGEESVTVRLESMYPTLVSPLKPQYTQSSFIVDGEEASSQAFIAGFAAFKRSDDILEDIASYTNTFITDPTYQNSFQLMSQVATSRSGDCKEYAVLATGLARSLGLNARILFGVVVFNVNGEASAFGHAWAEVWHQDQWHIVDAALYDDQDYDFWYVPAAELANEGFGYRFATLDTIQYLPSKIRDFSSH